MLMCVLVREAQTFKTVHVAAALLSVCCEQHQTWGQQKAVHTCAVKPLVVSENIKLWQTSSYQGYITDKKSLNIKISLTLRDALL